MAGSLQAQGWSGEVQAGEASFRDLPVEATSQHLGLGLRYGMDHRLFQSTLAVPLSSDGLLWGVVNVADRWTVGRGRWEFGVDASGLAHAQEDRVESVRGWGVRGELLPLLSVSAGPAILQLRAGGSGYAGAVGGEGWTRNLGTGDATLSLPLGSSGRVEGALRHVRATDEEYSFAGLSASVGGGHLAAWGSAGSWVSGLPEGVASTAWGLGMAASVTAKLSLWGTVRREAFDPFFLSGSRTSWSIALRRTIGSPSGGGSGAGAHPRSGGEVLLRIPLSAAERPPSVAGDFSGWEPIPMNRRGAYWEAELHLEPGLYSYAFRRADGGWFVPESIPGRQEDGMGGWVAVLVVPPEAGVDGP